MGISPLGRMLVCTQVMRTMLDKIEREEKQKRPRRPEVDDRGKRQAQNKVTSALVRQKENLKKEMLRKRALMEKTLQVEISVSSPCFRHIK